MKAIPMKSQGRSGKKMSFLTGVIFFLISLSTNAQYDVTGIYTDYTGFWSSSSTSLNPTKPVNSHNLLAFTWNGTTFSTGVDDAKLTANGVTLFSPKDFRAFPINSVTGDYIGLGQLADGVNGGASSPVPFTTPATGLIMASYLTDGIKGLNIGTGIANITAGQLRFNLSSLGISAGAINDGVPDVVVTQVAAPSSDVDSIYFVDASGAVVGSRLSISHVSVAVVAKWNADFYGPSGTLTGSLTNTERDIRLWAADLTSFGITAGNVGDAVALVYRLKGSSDVAFVAFNVPSISVATQLSITTQPGTSSFSTCCNNSGGTALSPQPVIQVRDGSGNIISQAGITITASVASGPSTLLGGTVTATTNATGQATFSGLILPCDPGAYTLVFTSSNLDPVTSNTSTVVKPAFYVKPGSSGNISSVSNWSANADGSGASPADFSSGKEFILSNTAGDAVFTTSANWTVTGKLTVPSGKTLTISAGTTTTLSCDISQSGTITAATGAALVLNGTAAQTLAGTNNLKNFTINNGAGVLLTGNTTVDNTLSLTTGTVTLGANTLTIKDVIVRTSGNINASALSATVIWSGSSAQTISTSVFTGSVYNLTINNTSGVTTNTNLNISNVLSLLDGRFTIGNFNISAGSVTGGSTGTFVQTNGTGKLGMNILTGAGNAKLFPAGNSTYNPVTITNNNATSDVFAVRVLDNVYDNGTSGSPVNSAKIMRTWDIDKTGANTGSGVKFLFNWHSAQNNNVVNPALFHFESGTWVKQTSGITTPGSTSLEYTGYTGTFSPFAIGDNNATLPLVWKSFTAHLQEERLVLLSWQTTNEENTKDFIIQHSADAVRWSNIGSVTASPDNNHSGNYSFVHTSPLKGDNYYRIIQTDIDGRNSYSSTRMIRSGLGKNELIVLNNPVKNSLLLLQVPETQETRLFTANGKLVWQKKLSAGMQAINVSGLAKGIYILKTAASSVQIAISNQ